MMKEFNVVIIKREKGYIARCMELGIACRGETEAEAKAGLVEAVEALLESYRDQAKTEGTKTKTKPASP